MSGMVIIGAGECGVRAAFALRENGFQGAITLVGAEASLPYERPPLSKQMDGAGKPIRAADAYREARIDLRLDTTVAAIDTEGKCVRLADGATLEYDKLLLATGARPRVPKGMERCLTLRTDRDAEVIVSRFGQDRHIGLIGGGFIGMELAATARTAGANVTVVETAQRILYRAVPQDIASAVHTRHTQAGVRILTDTKVSAASDTRIVLTDGTEMVFDAVIAGVGAIPNTDLAERADLSVDNGILVDDRFRTSNRDVFAAGDCCNFKWHGERIRLESWKAAQDQGSHVASSMLGTDTPSAKVPYFWSDQYDLTLQVVGLFDGTNPIRRRTSEDETVMVFQCDADDRLTAAAGVGPGNAVAKDIRIFEKLIERAVVVEPNALADPSHSLKQLLKAA